ncbi:hypothetical protein [Flavobacterium sp.]|uniref:hypothetical protein n=1 Tax=Flavobacterium sp. TaxID=239 RepID=UPI0008BFCE4F|nr:hypothetical protein [Flavobacterium sp.]OGS61255.1 MAG: hypothetical protein A2X07_06370 [Flavobacteria bacterium GWF1_32_7]HBD25673.1 hypothetical protein [Flavobacterium sp.]
MKKISVNKLAEYLKADSVRRRRIIEDQKEPMDFIAIRYADARKAMINYIIKDFNKSIIENEIEQLSSKINENDFQENDVKTSIEALNCFLNIELPEELLKFRRVKSNKKYILKVKDLNININPDILIKGTIKNKPFIGGIKFNIVKGHKLNDDDRKNVATLIHQVLEEQSKDTPNLNFCISIDVFNMTFDNAPKSYKMRRKQIEFACDELGIIWDSI